MRRTLWLTLVAAGAAAAAPRGGGTSRSCLPRLNASGTLFGAAFGGSTSALVNAEFVALADAGARLAQVSITWATLEPTPGVISAGQLVESLLGVRALGLTPIVNIAAIDTNNVGVPSDLRHPTDPTRLAPGLTWQSQTVIDRFALALQTLAPIAAYYGAVYVGVGNEVDVNLGAHPETGYDFVVLVDVMGSWIRNLTSPDMATGVTLTVGGINSWGAAAADGSGSGPPAWWPVLAQVADVTPLTYYPLQGNFSVKPPSVVAGELASAVAALPDTWCVVLQEFGYPSGYNNGSSTDGSSYALQAAFVGAAFDALAGLNATGGFDGGGRVRAASFCMFQDMPAATCAALAPYYNVTSPAFVEYLCTLGLVANDDAGGVLKPAYTAFLDRLKAAGAGGGHPAARG
jgi:hypothetical protein